MIQMHVYPNNDNWNIYNMPVIRDYGIFLLSGGKKLTGVTETKNRPHRMKFTPWTQRNARTTYVLCSCIKVLYECHLTSRERACQPKETDKLEDETHNEEPRVARKIWVGDQQTPQDNQNDGVEHVANVSKPIHTKHDHFRNPGAT